MVAVAPSSPCFPFLSRSRMAGADAGQLVPAPAFRASLRGMRMQTGCNQQAWNPFHRLQTDTLQNCAVCCRAQSSNGEPATRSGAE